MSTKPMVSVVCPAYNGERFIAAAIHSVQAQTIKKWQLVVVNDGSTDKTLSIAEAIAREDYRIRILSQKNAGLPAARNAGIAASNAPIVAFLDCDDCYSPEALELLVSAIERNPLAIGSHGMWSHIKADGSRQRFGIAPSRRWTTRGPLLRSLKPNEPTTLETLAFFCCARPSATAIRRDILDAIGGFDTGFPACEDWDMLLRASVHGHFEFVAKVTTLYRIHGNQSTASRARITENEKRVQRALLCNPALNIGQRLQCAVAIGYRAIYDAKIAIGGWATSLDSR